MEAICARRSPATHAAARLGSALRFPAPVRGRSRKVGPSRSQLENVRLALQASPGSNLLTLLSQPSVGPAKLLVFEVVAQIARERRARGKRATAQWHPVMVPPGELGVHLRSRVAAARSSDQTRDSTKRCHRSQRGMSVAKFVACTRAREQADKGPKRRCLERPHRQPRLASRCCKGIIFR